MEGIAGYHPGAPVVETGEQPLGEAADRRVEGDQALAAAARLVFGRQDQRAAEPAPAGGAMHHELGELGPVPLVLRRRHDDMDHAAKDGAGEGSEEHAVTGPHRRDEGVEDSLGLCLPDAAHEGHGGPALDTVHQDGAEFRRPGRDRIGVQAHDTVAERRLARRGQPHPDGEAVGQPITRR